MLGASRRSLSAAAAARSRVAAGAASAVSADAAASIPPRPASNGAPGVHQQQKRLLSVLVAPKVAGTSNVVSLKLMGGALTGRRYESSAAAVDSTDPPAEKHEYQAEVNRLMDLIVHSLYSNKEVFLRELVSNASDALDKLRYLSVTDPELLKDGPQLDIRIQTDKDNGIITITDSGIGMTKQELIDSLGTIASSGTAKFLKALKESQEAGMDNNLIGQFGVGFYSAFLVSEKVVVSTKSPKSDKQYVWEGQADSGSYTIREEKDPEQLIPRGTRLTLYLKCDDKGFAHPERIQKLLKTYSQFVSFPIYTWEEKGFTKEVEVDEDPAEAQKKGDDSAETKTEPKKKTKTVIEKYWDWELSNETQPIWLRNPKEVSTEEYNDFFKKTFNEYLGPLASSHFTTEGEVEFRSILFVPATRKEDVTADSRKTKNIRLYVKRVFISDDFDGELFPRYLSFVKGVVDSNDLPLNVSREILQESRIVRIMRKRLVRKAFDMILGISCSENRDDYERFWENFGKFLKLGAMEDKENHKRIAPLLRFFSSQSNNELISLDEYVENMKPEQKDIYFIAADSMSSAINAPFLERLTEKDYEVLLLVDPMDELAIQNLSSYKDKKFVDISKEDLDLGDNNEEREKEIKQEFSQACDWIKNRLGDKVARVDISNRLRSSPCVLVAAKFGWSANMERLMRAQSMGDTASLDFMRSRKVFEINPEHEIIKALNVACRNNPDDPEALKALDVLFETAMISSGFSPDNPAELSGKIYEMMTSAIAGKWSSQPQAQAQPADPIPQHDAPVRSDEPLEAQVVEAEPVEAGQQK
ncbi:Heat shock protein 90-6, mitochondrial [Zea mays]|uniref:Heat shock protein 90-6 mitochondrial n=2 Tax=Zea mays TaxID=4577 RepID=C0PDG3_MAIZE|nr:heat shock protein 90-6, mitochondrial [Zea mays]ACN33229.1 unknown [Zea mays]ONM33566.1 Heat shock protein 90-6 mitochondrial [Zea mays]PWZ34575.1 Heat shock protein 90-6, mitochondrial [Zea mays]|eukprot:XP_008674382.2 heat shock protein 90-6, mitochondrial [Zea mays]